MSKHLVVKVDLLFGRVIRQDGLHLVPFQGSLCADQPAEEELGHLPVVLTKLQQFGLDCAQKLLISASSVSLFLIYL